MSDTEDRSDSPAGSKPRWADVLVAVPALVVILAVLGLTALIVLPEKMSADRSVQQHKQAVAALEKAGRTVSLACRSRRDLRGCFRRAERTLPQDVRMTFVESATGGTLRVRLAKTVTPTVYEIEVIPGARPVFFHRCSPAEEELLGTRHASKPRTTYCGANGRWGQEGEYGGSV